MNRRAFLTSAVIGVAAVAVAPSLIRKLRSSTAVAGNNSSTQPVWNNLTEADWKAR